MWGWHAGRRSIWEPRLELNHHGGIWVSERLPHTSRLHFHVHWWPLPHHISCSPGCSFHSLFDWSHTLSWQCFCLVLDGEFGRSLRQPWVSVPDPFNTERFFSPPCQRLGTAFRSSFGNCKSPGGEASSSTRLPQDHRLCNSLFLCWSMIDADPGFQWGDLISLWSGSHCPSWVDLGCAARVEVVCSETLEFLLLLLLSFCFYMSYNCQCFFEGKSSRCCNHRLLIPKLFTCWSESRRPKLPCTQGAFTEFRGRRRYQERTSKAITASQHIPVFWPVIDLLSKKSWKSMKWLSWKIPGSSACFRGQGCM